MQGQWKLHVERQWIQRQLKAEAEKKEVGLHEAAKQTVEEEQRRAGARGWCLLGYQTERACLAEVGDLLPIARAGVPPSPPPARDRRRACCR